MSYGFVLVSGTRSSSSGVSRRGSSSGGEPGRVVQVVGREIREEVADCGVQIVLVGGDEVGDAADGRMGVGAAERLMGDVFAGDRLDDVRAGDEHLADAVDHEDEIGHRRGVDGAAGAWAGDDGDLGDHARGADVAEEDLAVAGQPLDPLLDPGPGRVVDADDRAAVALGQVHQLDDLLGEGFAERAAEDGEVLGEDRDLAARRSRQIR